MMDPTILEERFRQLEDTPGTCPECETPNALVFTRGLHLTDGNANCSACGYWNWGNGGHKLKAHQIKMERIAARIESAAERVEAVTRAAK